MKEPRHTAEEYRLICIILAVVILIMGYLWNRGDNQRLKHIAELEQRIADLQGGNYP